MSCWCLCLLLSWALQFDGETALLIAADNGKTEVVKVLVEVGADVNQAETVRHRTSIVTAVDVSLLVITPSTPLHSPFLSSLSPALPLPSHPLLATPTFLFVVIHACLHVMLVYLPASLLDHLECWSDPDLQCCFPWLYRNGEVAAGEGGRSEPSHGTSSHIHSHVCFGCRFPPSHQFPPLPTSLSANRIVVSFSLGPFRDTTTPLSPVLLPMVIPTW